MSITSKGTIFRNYTFYKHIELLDLYMTSTKIFKAKHNYMYIVIALKYNDDIYDKLRELVSRECLK